MKQNSRLEFVLASALTGMLVLAACASPAVPAAAPTSSNSIQGILWQWTSVTNQTTKQTTTVPKRESGLQFIQWDLLAAEWLQHQNRPNYQGLLWGRFNGPAVSPTAWQYSSG